MKNSPLRSRLPQIPLFLLLLIACLAAAPTSQAAIHATSPAPSRPSIADTTKPVSTPADTSAVLFRGRMARRYAKIYNGTPYWDTTGFALGRVMYNGRLYEEVYVDVNATEQELCVRSKPGYAAVNPVREEVSWFTKGDRLFVNMAYQGYEDAAAGYYEVLHDGGSTLLHRVDKAQTIEPGEHNGKSIGYYDDNYNIEFIEYYRQMESFYLLRDGRMIRFRGMSGLAQLYPEKKRELKKFIRQSGLKISNAPRVEKIAAVMRRAEGGSGKDGRLTASLVDWKPIDGDEYSSSGMPSVFASKYKQPVSGKLPEGWFEERRRHDDDASSQETVEAMYQNKIYEIGDPKLRRGSRATITGTITDAANGQPLQDAVVFDANTETYVRSDAKGRYSITLPFGENELHFSEMTKEELKLKVVVNSSGSLDVSMNERITQLNEAMISAESRAAHRTTKMGVQRVSMKTISKIPSAFGEGDVLKAVLTLPGVETVGEASSGFNVRGGSSDQNLILFNEGTIYNPSHLFGVFSAFNPDVVESVELYKSSIPAEFGGRISSVLDITGKEGSREKIKGSLGIGVLTSHGAIEGPIGKKTTFVAGVRTTYSDWILDQIPESSGYSNGSAGFTDVNLGITHRLNASNTVQLFGYWSHDRFAFTADTTFYYENLNIAAKWRHEGNGGHSFDLSAGYDRYSNTLKDYVNATEAYKLKTIINQVFLRARFKYETGNHSIGYGLDMTAYALEGGRMRPYGEESLVLSKNLDTEYALQPAFYLSDVWQLTDEFSLDYGVRLATFLAIQPDTKFYVNPEFRLSGKYSFNSNLSVKAGVNTMSQNIHLVSNTTSISPMDTWKLSDPDIKPTTGWQGAGGIYWTVAGGKLDLSVEAYWKNTRNYLDYKSGATLAMNENLADDLVRTRGKAYGIELMAHKTVGKLSGWLSYTYSRSFLKEMEDRGLSTINGGDWYRASYDKPHDVKLSGNYALTRRYSFSFNLNYSTGRPVTVPVGYFNYGGGYRLAYSDRNSYRIPDYFRLDLAVNIDPGHYLRQLTHTSLTIGCYNVTGRKNTYSVYYTTDEGRSLKGYKVSVFASQIPYINLNILF